MLYSSDYSDLQKSLGTCCWLLVGRRFDALQTSSRKVLRGDSARFPEISFLRFDFDMPLDIARIWLASQQCMLDPIDSRPGCAVERPQQQMSKSGVWFFLSWTSWTCFDPCSFRTCTDGPDLKSKRKDGWPNRENLWFCLKIASASLRIRELRTGPESWTLRLRFLDDYWFLLSW